MLMVEKPRKVACCFTGCTHSRSRMISVMFSPQVADHCSARFQVPVHGARPGAGPAAVSVVPAPHRAEEGREGAVRAALSEGGGPVPGSLPREGPGLQARAGQAVGSDVGLGTARGQLTPDRGSLPGPAELYHPLWTDQYGQGTLEAVLWISM